MDANALPLGVRTLVTVDYAVLRAWLLPAWRRQARVASRSHPLSAPAAPGVQDARALTLLAIAARVRIIHVGKLGAQVALKVQTCTSVNMPYNIQHDLRLYEPYLC